MSIRALGYLDMINMDGELMQAQLIDYKVQDAITSVVTKIAGHALCQDDLKDLVQDVNIKALTHKFDPNKGSIEGWVCSIAQNVAIDALRKLKRKASLPASDRLASPCEGNEADRLDNFIDSMSSSMSHTGETDRIISVLTGWELSECVLRVLRTLSSDDQQFIMYFLSEDYNIEAYAQKLGVAPVTIRVRKHRLIEHLQQLLSEIES
jgi:RNA polymerase sigma factor (sigma-70 family)